MDPITQALINVGGFGVFAAALFWLHRDTIARFEQQMNAERKSCDEKFIKVIEKLDEVKDAI